MFLKFCKWNPPQGDILGQPLGVFQYLLLQRLWQTLDHLAYTLCDSTHRFDYTAHTCSSRNVALDAESLLPSGGY